MAAQPLIAQLGLRILPYAAGYTPGLGDMQWDTVAARIQSNSSIGITGNLTVAQGAITTDKKAVDLTATWNNVATTFTGILQNITDTASAVTSKLFDLQVGGASKFTVNKAGLASTVYGVSVAQGTITADQKILDLSSTWNSGSTTFVGIQQDITPTTFASNSKLFQFLVNGASRMSADITGGLSITQGTLSLYTTPALTMTANWQTGGLHYGIFLNVTDTSSSAVSPLMDLQVGSVSRHKVDKTGALIIAQGTISSVYPALDISTTWNNGGATFTGIRQNITDTASAVGSLLMNLQVGSVSVCSVRKDGRISATSEVLAQGTITAAAPILDLSTTWNNAGVTFTGILQNVTDTASAAGSLLMDLQVGGTSKFKVGKGGDVTIAGKLTVAGLIDPTGLALTPVAANPGGALVTSTIWVNSADSNKLYFGAAAVGGGTPGGANTQVQFNDSSAFGGSSGFAFNKTTGILTLTKTYTGVMGGGGIVSATSTASTGASGSNLIAIQGTATATAGTVDPVIGGVFSAQNSGSAVTTNLQGIQVSCTSNVDADPVALVKAGYFSAISVGAAEAVSVIGIEASASGGVTNWAAKLNGDTYIFGGKLLLQQGTIAANAPMLDLSATWNDGLVAFTGVDMNVTVTSADILSKLVRLRVGGTDMLTVDTVGEMYLASALQVGTNGSYSLSFGEYDAPDSAYFFLDGGDFILFINEPITATTHTVFTAGYNGLGVSVPFALGSAQNLKRTAISLASTVNATKNTCIYEITTGHASNQLNLHASPSDGDTVVVINNVATASVIGAQSSKNIQDISTGSSAATFSQPARTIRTYVYNGTLWLVG